MIYKASFGNTTALVEGTPPPQWNTLYNKEPDPAESVSESNNTQNEFCRDFEQWRITYESRTLPVNHLKGLEYMARIIRNQGKPCHVFELDHHADGSKPALDNGAQKNVSNEGLRPDKSPYSLDDKVDKQTVHEVDQAINIFRKKIQEAKSIGDSDAVAKAYRELTRLIDYKKSSTGLSGRSRRFSTPEEKSRKTVTKCIRTAINKIAQLEKMHNWPSDLSRHLSNFIKTGVDCKYTPDKPTAWYVQL
jgi:hypothetical protein